MDEFYESYDYGLSGLETMALAEDSFCPESGDNLDVDPRIEDPRSILLSFPKTDQVCCHKEKQFPLPEEPDLKQDDPFEEPVDNNCESFSDIGFR